MVPRLMNTLKDLRARGRIDTSNPVHTECLRFYVTDVIYAELYRIVFPGIFTMCDHRNM
jgi:hypothetical protein